MKRFTSVVLFLTLAGVVAHAQTPPPTAPAAAPRQTAPAASVPATPPNPGSKIGIMIFQDAVFDSDAGKAAVAAIQKLIDPSKTALEKLSKEMQDLQTKLQNSKVESEQAQIRKDIDAKSVEGKRVQEDAERLSQDLQAKHLQPVAMLVNKIVDEYAKANNLAVVIDPSTQDSNIIFAAKSSDITNEVIRMMNAAYQKDPKITAPNAAAPAGAPAPNAPPPAVPKQ